MTVKHVQFVTLGFLLPLADLLGLYVIIQAAKIAWVTNTNTIEVEQQRDHTISFVRTKFTDLIKI